MVPTGTPADVVAKINAETNNALQMPDVRTKLRALGAEIAGGTPEAFNTFLKSGAHEVEACSRRR
jgi:tripartite-type tricarboxylate transporter receptor subunit TctC